ncbi:XPG domain containing-domain-containing protein [Exophiala viscosa]|uniref:XPG domain containing-domain-containing protein n=1 Tax=Exophiala viscosa TaxID=2486360 RepID=A0AAN6E696_9EURO|nr:XPG domain containing-domain-containing protein [Exophiala viscosa]
MGIPRLSQDLLPYSEQRYLGTPLGQSPRTKDRVITSLIIDGPSLVYYIYNKLLAYKSSTTPTLTAQLPSYVEINQALDQFLSELEDRGVGLQDLFFDGALPKSKRDIRLERMEKLRHQLETYRKMYPEFSPVASSHQTLDLEKALWNTPVMSTRKLALPAPPFMVASAIESLRSGKFAAQVRVVPGEADMYCADASNRTGAAILTNDSDLVVHDLGIKGRVILLHSLEKKQAPRTTHEPISALTLHPITIARSLQASSLLRVGFERYLDPSLSILLVKERARDDSRLEKMRAEFDRFAEQYVTILPAQPPQPQIDGLDPRTAELVVTFPDSPHIYLTPLIEDPSRDSSWSYGTNIRQLAYSFLCIAYARSTSNSIIEYARKGQRISASTVQSLLEQKLQARTTEVLEHLDTFDIREEAAEQPLLTWYILAFHLIHQQKLDAGKTTPELPQIANLFGLHPSSSRPSWDDIHLLANMHAVLYSFRILHQILHHIMPRLTESSQRNEELIHMVQKLLDILDRLPTIADLFLDVGELRVRVGNMSLKVRNTALANLGRLLQLPVGESEAHLEGAIPQYQNDLAQNQGEEWQSTTRKRKRKRVTQQSQEPTTRSTNMFDLLIDR